MKTEINCSNCGNPLAAIDQPGDIIVNRLGRTVRILAPNAPVVIITCERCRTEVTANVAPESLTVATERREK